MIHVVNPAPDTVDEALRVVNEPAPAVDPPILKLLRDPTPPEVRVIVADPVVVYDWLFDVVFMLMAPVAPKVVNAPVFAAVDPIGGGLARYEVKPLPEMVLDALKVVNAPVLADVLPIGGGDDRYVLNPEPETVLDALRVVNAPEFADVDPNAGGDAK